MADEKPKVDLAGIEKGVELKSAPEVQDKTLAQASILKAIDGQGVIAVPAERAPKESNEALNRALILNEIGKGGVISAQSDPLANNPALEKAKLLNEIAHQGVISVPEGSAPDTSLSKEKLAALQQEAASEKKEIAEALDSHKGKLKLDLDEAKLKHVDAPKESDEGLKRGGLLNAIKSKGGVSVDPSKIPAKDNALLQASVLGAIKTQGVISVPEGAAPNRELTDEQKAALLEDAKAEKKEDAENLDAHKKKMDLSGLGDVNLKHQDAPVEDHSETVKRAGLLNELAKNT